MNSSYQTLSRRAGRTLTQSVISMAFLGLVGLTGPALAQGAGQYALTGKVVQVSDGDTINLLVDKTQHRIRLASIDAPETSHGSERPGQPFGEASRKNLADYVAGKTLTLTCYEKDHYGRDVCDVPANGTTANRLQVQDGMAWANQQAKGKFLRDKSLVGIQSDAQKKKLGLWAEAGAVAPWEWRVVCWQNKKCK
jgi:micrococcal nuclease